ncbi:hypothetical protein EJ110_NYTH60259 [Nymphaea thermarum]|nr:hypothetical protein EJ110_NYTH60259 [Nymphaea thermarum]
MAAQQAVAATAQQTAAATVQQTAAAAQQEATAAVQRNTNGGGPTGGGAEKHQRRRPGRNTNGDGGQKHQRPTENDNDFTFVVALIPCRNKQHTRREKKKHTIYVENLVKRLQDPKATPMTLNDKNEAYDTWLHAEVLRQGAEMLPKQKEQATNEPETVVDTSLGSTASLENMSSSPQQDDPPRDNRFSGLDVGEREAPDYLLFLQARVENVCLRSLFANHQTFNVMGVQSLNVDEKWQGAPFAALLRRHQLDNNDATDQILSIIVISQSGNTSVTEVKYCSIVVQPLDLNFDEETVMKIVPFWRTSLSDPNSTRQQIYFKHFEIHPIKIIASFLPGNLNMSYSTSQEALWSFLHNVIKVPTVKAAVVELNGVLLTHALLTTRELLIKCMQHYSWYAMRAIYIAKGSSLLPPSFASIFDDSAFSSLDVFFDPSSSLHSLPGLTIGCI